LDLQVSGFDGVYAGGDAAAVPNATNPGTITPPTAQHANRQAKVPNTPTGRPKSSPVTSPPTWATAGQPNTAAATWEPLST
jgi:NADPH-dependent 2,4-dienoyl-CoA reductase/sulfur reductase-like enzyme